MSHPSSSSAKNGTLFSTFHSQGNRSPSPKVLVWQICRNGQLLPPSSLYIPGKKAIQVCRILDIQLNNKDNPLPSMSTLPEGISRHCQDEERQDSVDVSDAADDMISRGAYLSLSRTAITFKSKLFHPRLPLSFAKSLQSPQVAVEDGMNPIPCTWDFKVKNSLGSDVPLFLIAPSCLRGDRQECAP